MLKRSHFELAIESADVLDVQIIYQLKSEKRKKNFFKTILGLNGPMKIENTIK